MAEKRKHPEIPAPPQGFGLFQQIIEQLRLTWFLLLDNRVSLLLKLVPIIGLAYFVSPVNIVLDSIPPLGLLVDVAVILVAVVVFNNLAPDYVVADHLTRMRTRSSYRIRQDTEGTIVDVTLPDQAEHAEDEAPEETPAKEQKASRH